MEGVHKSKHFMTFPNSIKCCENLQVGISLVSDSSSSLKEVAETYSQDGINTVVWIWCSEQVNYP